MGLYTEISIEDVIARTKMQLRIANTGEHDDFLQVLIMEGLRQLECLSLYTKQQCDLTVCDRRAKVPDGMMKFIGMRHKFTNDLDRVQCSYVYYWDKAFMNDCGCNNLTFPANSQVLFQGMQIQNGYFVFNDNISDDDIVTIAYLGFNLDKDKNIKIYERYERALMYYAMWNFADSYPANIYPEPKILRWRSQWVQQKAHLKGLDAADNFRNTKREVGIAFQALVTSNIVTFLG